MFVGVFFPPVISDLKWEERERRHSRRTEKKKKV